MTALKDDNVLRSLPFRGLSPDPCRRVSQHRPTLNRSRAGLSRNLAAVRSQFDASESLMVCRLEA